MQVHFIDTEERLIPICQQFSQSEFLALDTEFVRQKTYYPVLALVQICDGQQIALIDPTTIKDLSALMTLLYNEQITKVLHSARQDMEILYCLNQAVPQALFDTQIAAALLGYGEQIGYAALVKRLLNVELDKSQTRTDWLKRPLTQKQLTYAADDVRHLAELYPMQKQMLEDKNRLSWLQDDFRILSSKETYEPSPETIWRKIKGVNRLKNQKLAILRNLSAWRENLAIRQNRPRRRVVSDEVLMELAINPPEQSVELGQYKGLNPQFLKYNADNIMKQIQDGLNTANKDCPRLPDFKKLTQNEEALADCLMAVIHLSAHENHVSPQSLCTRKDVDALIRGKRDLAILNGWRNELVGKQLLKFLAGDTQLSFSSGQLKLINT